MLPPRRSDPPHEETFIGDARLEEAPLDERGAQGASRRGVGPRDRGKAIALGAMGALVAVGIGLMAASPRRGASTPALSVTTEHGSTASAEPGDRADAAVAAPVVRPPPAWRVAALKDDPSVEVTEGTFGKRGLVATLTRAGLSRKEIKRVAQAFAGVRRVDRPRERDAFVVAKDKASAAVVAFEYASSPMDVWQAREEGPERRLVAKKLELFVEHRRAAHGLVVRGDLAATIAAAGLPSEIVAAVDDALEAHVEPGSIRAGARMRIAATEDWVEGAYVRVNVDAVDLVPRMGPPLRVYYYERDPDEVDGSPRRAPAPGFYDARARQPYRGQFRSPVPLARVTSRFNPKRLHPVLKVIKPHNGVDYAGSTGTPVYASAPGTVTTAGNGGPCGNMVEIEHGGGIRTIYCHLKGFAQGVRAGIKVEARQLVGYVGQTGRVTGPHLHFAVKKNGAFIDPLRLKMDGIRVLPPADRDIFQRRRAELDVILDGVALPSAADVPDDNEEKDEGADLHAD